MREQFEPQNNGFRKLFQTLLAAVKVATKEAEARNLAEQLAVELAEAVAERDRFIDIAAHELKTPLTALRLHLQLVDRTLERAGTVEFDEEKCRKTVHQTLRQCDRLSTLIEDMLEVSRIHAGRFVIRKKPESVSEILRETFETHRPAFSAAGCETSIDIEPGIEAAVDEERLSRLYSSLFSNVVRHAPASEVEVSLFREGSKIVTSVRDTGPGIPPDRHEAVFGKTAMSDPLSGLGLSLHISRAIARAHGGELTVNAQWEKGAEFILELPIELN